VYNGATLKIAAPTVSRQTTLQTLGATSTVEYNGTNQSVGAATYGHLTLSNSGTKTIATATSVAGISPQAELRPRPAAEA